jgi:hypothetical protein
VDRGEEVVAPADVREFMDDGGVKLLGREVLFDPGGQ